MKKLILFICLLIPFVLKAQVSPVTPQWKGGNSVNYLPYTWPGKTHPDTIGNLKLIRQMIGTKTNDSIIFDIHHFTYVDSILRVANDTIGTGNFFVFDKTTGFGRRDTSTHLTNWLHADFRLHNNGFKFQPDSILIKQSIFTAGLFGREFDFSDSTETAQYKFNGFKFYKKSDSTQNYVRVRFLSDSTYWQGKPITWNNVNNFKNLVYFRDVPTGSNTDSVLVSHGGVVEKIGPISVTASNGLNTDNGDIELGGDLTAGFTDIGITGNTVRFHSTDPGINNIVLSSSSFQSYHTDNIGNASEITQNSGGGQNLVSIGVHQNIFDIGDRTIVFQIDSVMGAHLTDYTLKGIKYNFTGHYSLLTDSSLVPKRYVDSLVASGGGGTTTNALTLSYGLTGQPLTFNGSVARTATVDSTVMVNKTFAGRYVQTNTNASVKSNSISGTGGLGFDDLISQSASPTSVTNHIRLYSDSLNRLSWKNSTYRRTLQIPYPSDYTARFPYRVTGTTLEDSTHAATTYATIGSVVTYTASNGVVKTGTNFTSDTTYNRTVNNSPTLAQLQTKFNLKVNVSDTSAFAYVHKALNETITGTKTITANGIANTPTDRFILQNATAATVGATVQYSSALDFLGTAWNSTGAVSQNNGMRAYLATTAAAGNTSSTLNFDFIQTSTGLYGTRYSFGSGGATNFTGGTFTNSISGGANTDLNGIVSSNNTASTSGVPAQYAPAFTDLGTVWNTSGTPATNNFGFRWTGRATSGSSPIINWVMQSGLSATTLTWADRLGMDNNGLLTVYNGNLKLATAGNKIQITEGTNGSVGQTTLVAGTKAITISGLTTSSRAIVTLVSQGGTVTTTTAYAAVCTSNTLTITALTNAGVTDTTDTSLLNYWIVN